MADARQESVSERLVVRAIKEAGSPWSRRGLTALIEALWAVPHDDKITEPERTEALCLLSGMAVAALMDFRALMPPEEGDPE